MCASLALPTSAVLPAARLSRTVVASFDQIVPPKADELYDAGAVDTANYVFDLAHR